jgi:acetylornithine deacetylase/succinyl-diaminopimelate desuccinylase-like protein
MNPRLTRFTLSLLCLACVPALAQTPAPLSPAQVAAQVREYRRAHEHAIVQELVDLLSIPNTAGDAANIGRNAEKLVTMLQRRGFRTQLLPIPGRGPVVFGELKTPGARRTVIFYAHYDGQPAEPGGWSGTKPFAPVLRTATTEAGGKLIPFPSPGTPYQDDWRLYARSAADDKSPIEALLAALDALRARHIPLAVNLKLVLEGEEEAGSPHLEETLMAHRDLLAGDVLLSADGPVHPSGRPLLYFGNRGVVGVKITVYGPLHPLHSGHYGNWAPNPAMRLAQLLASMKDADGRVLIAGFYDDVAPLGAAERQALRDLPDMDAQLLADYGLARPDGGGKSLAELITQPSLNVDGLASGWTGAQGKTIIPDTAVASLDLRLVKNIQPARQVERLIAHLRKQGYLVLDREPTMQERRQYPRIARVEHDHGYPAAATPMDSPVSQALMQLTDQALGEPAVKEPLLGGSVPMYIFEDLKLSVIGVPIVNYDDNQHAPNENLRLGNLWRGMELYGAILAGLRW